MSRSIRFTIRISDLTLMTLISKRDGSIRPIFTKEEVTALKTNGKLKFVLNSMTSSLNLIPIV